MLAYDPSPCLSILCLSFILTLSFDEDKQKHGNKIRNERKISRLNIWIKMSWARDVMGESTNLLMGSSSQNSLTIRDWSTRVIGKNLY
jgi:hypothetical protein